MKRVVISGLICMAILFELLTVKNARLQVVLTDYAAVLESNGLDGLRLSVYYIDPSILTRFPLTEERLLSFESVQRFDVDNAQLLQNIELLKTINAEEMTPVSNTSVLDARLCCIFESDRAGQILRLTLGGKDNSIFVNEVEVENCELLHDSPTSAFWYQVPTANCTGGNS